MKRHSAARQPATPVLSFALNAENPTCGKSRTRFYFRDGGIMELDQMTDQFDQFLKESGHYFGPRVRLLVQVFCDSKEPLGAKEMLYRVKRLDPLVSFGTVYRFLTLLAASGLATTIPRERRGPLRFAKVTHPKGAWPMQPCAPGL